MRLKIFTIVLKGIASLRGLQFVDHTTHRDRLVWVIFGVFMDLHMVKVRTR